MKDAHLHLNSFPTSEVASLLDAALARGCTGGLVAGVWNDDTRALAAWAEDPAAVSPRLCFSYSGAIATQSPSFFASSADRYTVSLAHGLHPAWLPRHCGRIAPDGSARPHSPEQALQAAVFEFEEILCARRKIICAVGETGFDAHPHLLADARGFGLEKQEVLALQERAFDALLFVAQREGLPLIFHSRSAWSRTRAAVSRARAQGVGVMIHCYGGPAQDVEALASEGVFLSFGGVATWEKARKVREAFLACPLEALLLETDAPDLPVEFEDRTRPVRHEPAHIVDVAVRLAAIRGVGVETLVAAADANLRRYLSGPAAGSRLGSA